MEPTKLTRYTSVAAVFTNARTLRVEGIGGDVIGGAEVSLASRTAADRKGEGGVNCGGSRTSGGGRK